MGLIQLQPVDRRGLGETIGWASCLIVVGLMSITYLLKNGTIEPTLMGMLSGIVTAVMARSLQSASERSAVNEQRPTEPGMPPVAAPPLPPPLPPAP
jgi:hypothetical protein